MRKTLKKLSLHRDTVRVLLRNDLGTAAGGKPPSVVYCPPEPDTRVIEGCLPSGAPPCATNWTCIGICWPA